jgi:hypothetical protein
MTPDERWRRLAAPGLTKPPAPVKPSQGRAERRLDERQAVKAEASFISRGRRVSELMRLRLADALPPQSKRFTDPEYLRWVRSRPCCVCGAWPVEAHHAGLRGFGMKSADDTAIPLCTLHHRAWHDVRDPFRAMTKTQRGEWARDRIRETRAARVSTIALDM